MKLKREYKSMSNLGYEVHKGGIRGCGVRGTKEKDVRRWFCALAWLREICCGDVGDLVTSDFS